MEQRAWQDVAKDFGIKTDLSSLLSEIDSVIFDCDGVVWRGDAAIDKSKDFINALYKLGKKVLFVSNNATKTLAQYTEKFTKMSIPVEEYQINHSALATARYMKNNLEPKKKVYVVGTPGLVATLREHSGFEVIDGAKEHGNKGQKAMKTFDIDQLDKDVTVVVASVNDISYLQIHVAALYVRYRKCVFLSTNKDACANYLPSGTVAPAAGSMVSAIETACGQQSLNMGKPSKALIDSLVKQHGLNASRTLMVGDRLDTDIEFGKNGGLKTLLVLSGVTREEELQRILKDTSSDKHPDFIASSLADFSSYY